MDAVRAAMPDLKIGGVAVESADEFGVTYEWPLATKGVALVTHDGSPVTLVPGMTLQVNGQLVTIPKDPTEAATFLSTFSLTPPAPAAVTGPHGGVSQTLTEARGENGLKTVPAEERLHLIPWMGGYVLGYRPGYKHRYPTIEELAQ
jgi:hypothetical protein